MAGHAAEGDGLYASALSSHISGHFGKKSDFLCG